MSSNERLSMLTGKALFEDYANLLAKETALEKQTSEMYAAWDKCCKELVEVRKELKRVHNYVMNDPKFQK